MKRNSKFIETHELLSFEGILPRFEGVTFKKAKCQGVNMWLYAFRDTRLAAKEEKDWLAKNQKDGTYDDAEFKSKQRTFGTVVLESDKDMPPELAYRAYAERWQIEVVMKYYKSACEFDETRVHDDYSVIASEFCDFLATVLTYRLINFFAAKGALPKQAYGKIISILKRTYGKIMSILKRTYGKIMSILKRTYGKIMSILMRTYGKIMSILMRTYGKIMSILKRTYGKIMSILKRTYGKIMSILKRAQKGSRTETAAGGSSA